MIQVNHLPVSGSQEVSMDLLPINTNNAQYLPTGSYEVPDTVLCILYGDLCYSLWQWQIQNFCIWKNSVAQFVWKGMIGVGYKGVFA